MTSVFTPPARSKLRLDQTRDLLQRWRVMEKLTVLSLCLVYLLHSIWAARTVMWFLVVPLMLLSVVPYRRLLPIVTSSVFVMAAAFMLLIIGTTLLGDGMPVKELFRQLRYVAAVLVYIILIAYLVSRDEDFLRLLFLWLAPVAAFSVIRDVGSFSHWSLHAMLGTRLQGTPGLSVYYNPNYIGIMYAMPCVGAVAIMTTRKLQRIQFAMLLVSAGVLMVGITMTGSRGSLLAAFVGVVVALVLRASWRMMLIGACLIVVTLVLALLMPALGAMLQNPASLQATVPLATEMLQRGDSLRVELWTVYLQMVALKPWLGYGLMFDTRVILPSGNEVMHGHNIFLCAAIRGGVVSALTLAGLLIAALVSGWRGFRRTGEVTGLGLLAACLAATSVDQEIIPTDLNYLYILFWLPVAICLGAALATLRVPVQRPATPPADIAVS
ncbi:O-antigen ligase family protein [Rhodopseudomonas palustris]|uniref:O-antigen ligase family protein n=1 Tax=Rhodopseudomonas palustris TaxID=1076 RepID=UPI0021F3796F|nr:O-antigen ligase family protein [Rhodopseudomonas palustris]UYO53014.1 O-antigen ligase family protein [Rhodopseudomonas palustris]